MHSKNLVAIFELILAVITVVYSIESRKLIDDLEIIYNKTTKSKFPKEFTVTIDNIGELNLWKKRSLQFEKIKKDKNYPLASSNIYTISSGSRITKFDQNNSVNNTEFELYRQINGSSYATLIKTQGAEKFQMLGTIHESLDIYDIMPSINSNQKLSRNLMNSKAILNPHIIHKRSLSANQFDLNLKYFNDDKFQRNLLLKRMKRSDEALQLFCEVLVVTDLSVFEDHLRFSGSSNREKIFLHMKAYFAHLINGVNQRFQISLKNDPDFHITIKLTNYLFIDTEEESDWSSSKLHGVTGYPTYYGRPVVGVTSVYNAFMNKLNSMELPFQYDHAIGFLNKDLWSTSGESIEQKSSVNGYSEIGGICQSSKFSIIEERGGFMSVGIVAHELGHNLGALNDGLWGESSSACPESDNFIMTSGFGTFKKNLENLFKFSSCSLNNIKAALLTENKKSATEKASCLVNNPSYETIDLVNIDNKLPGQSFTADDQCKMIYGKTASFCHYLSATMCTTLSCRKSDKTTECEQIAGIGAAEGTTCGSGMMCVRGSCVFSTLVPKSNCPFGDDVVVNHVTMYANLPSPQLSCENAFDFISTVLNQLPLTYCNDERFNAACCKSCQKYESITCIDKSGVCETYASACNTGAAINGVNINEVCPRTCGVCDKSPLTCKNNLCKNGGKCTDLSYATNNLVGFKCDCTDAYQGYLCEKINQCKKQPCKNGGICQNFGSMGYICQCILGFTGQDCSNILTSTTKTTSTETTAATKTTTTTQTTKTTTTTTYTNIVTKFDGTTTAPTSANGTTMFQTNKMNPCDSNPCSSDYLCVLNARLNYECICISPNCFTKTTSPPSTTITVITSLQTSTTITALPYKTLSNTSTTSTIHKPEKDVGSESSSLNTCDSNPCTSGHICISNRLGDQYQCICVSSSCLEATTKVLPKLAPCIDLDPTACQFANKNRLCSNANYINAVQVTVYCKKSCQTCDYFP